MSMGSRGPRRGTPNGVTIHAVGYAHIDPVWLWRWTEGYQEARATFRSALDRMKEFPDYIFTCGQAAIYQWVEENDPAMIEEIAARVREGRWCLVGGWWTEADCNIPAGESFARQALYGQRWFRARFGVTAKTGFNPDAFGHNAMIPQIIRRSGMTSYLFMRPNRVENPDCPSVAFRWNSPDGSSILAYRLTHPYCTPGAELPDDLPARIATDDVGAARDLMLFYGVGNHGGGPTIRNLRSMERLRAAGHPRVIYGSPDTCFSMLAGVEDRLPSYEGEWQHHASGCYAAHSVIKLLNRRAENDLAVAERLSVIASRLAGWEYRGDRLARAWKNVLFCQFHDILAGSCIREACDDTVLMFGESVRIAGYETNGAAQRMATRIDTRGPGVPVIVFNPHSFPVRVAVEYGLTRESDPGTAGFDMTDESGREVPFQGTASSAIVKGMRRVCFFADLPAMGYRSYRIRCGAESTRATERVRAADRARDAESRIDQNDGLSWEVNGAEANTGYVTSSDGRDGLTVSNRWFTVAFDGRTGDIRRLRDKRFGLDVFRGSAAIPIVMDDPSDTWSHGVFSYDVQRGRFAEARVRVVEAGPVRIVVRAKSRFGGSTLTQDYIVYRDLPWISVKAFVDWRETHAVLKLSFPVNVESPVATYEIPYGHLERPSNGEEQPGQRWMDLTGDAFAEGTALRYGLSLLNDSLYSSDVRGSDMRLTVLRSPVYAHHAPEALDPDRDYAYMDQGERAFAYELIPHAGPWQEADTVREANVLNAPPFALVEHVHAGELAPVAEQIRVSVPNVVVTALKLREDGRDVVVRCHETAGRAAVVSLELLFAGRKVDFTIAPSEVKTFIVPADAAAAVRESDFLED